MLKEELIDYVKMLLESKKKKGLHGKENGDGKGVGHVRDYIMPLLSAEGRKKTLASVSKISASKSLDTLDTKSHGQKYDPKASHTHVLASKFGEHEAGTPVKVSHVTAGGDDGRSLTAHTSHGKIPMSKLAKPTELKKKPKTTGGFKVETKLSKHLGTKAAGSSASGFDFYYKGAVRGAVKMVEHKKKKAVKGTDRPDVRGESKLVKGKFGQSVVSFEKGKGWGFRNQSKMNSKLQQATVVGSDRKERTIIQHLNKYHSNGVIEKGFSAKAARGTARHYLNSSEINSLHIHNRKVDKRGKVIVDRGTTYTVGKTSLKGKTKLSHLSDKHIDRLDGNVNVLPTRTGKSEVTHRPSQAVMREFADNAHNNPNNHRDLTNADHATEFKTHVDRHITEYVKSKRKKKKKVNEEAPVNVAPTSPTSGNIQYAEPIMGMPMLRRKKPKTLQQFKEELIDDDNRKKRRGEVDRVTTRPASNGEHDVYVGGEKHKEVKVVNGSGGVAGLRRNVYGVHHIPKNRTRWVGSLRRTREHLQKMYDDGAL